MLEYLIRNRLQRLLATVVILAIAEKEGILSDIHKLNIRWDKQEGVEVDVNKPVTWKRSHQFATTQESI